MFPLFSVVLMVVVVGAFVAVTYYLRPSRGRHANPDGAAVTVASLCEGYAPVAMVKVHRTLPARRDPYDLLCGDAFPTVVIDDFDPERPDAPSLVRPYMHDVEDGQSWLAPFAPTERLRTLSTVESVQLSYAA